MNKVLINKKMENIPAGSMIFCNVIDLPILPFFLFSKKIFNRKIITLCGIERFNGDIYTVSPVTITESNKVIKVYRSRDMNTIYVIYYDK